MSRSFFNYIESQKIGKYYGIVDYNTSLNLQLNADLNIIVGNYDGRQLPGKVFIGLSINVPILYLKQSGETYDEAYELLKQFESVYIINNDIHSCENFLHEFKLTYQEINRDINELTCENISERLYKTLCKLK